MRLSDGKKPWPPGPADAAHPIPLVQRVYMVAIFTLTAALLYADQNLMAPNLTAIAREFHFNDEQRDRRAARRRRPAPGLLALERRCEPATDRPGPRPDAFVWEDRREARVH